MMALTCSLAACTGGNSSSGEKIIGKQNIKIKNGLMTPEVLWSMGRVGNIEVSPDGKNILYSVQYYSIPKNKGNKDLYTVSVSGEASVQLTKTAVGEQEAIWSADGSEIYFLSSESGFSQIWKMRKDGKKRCQLTKDTTDIIAFRISPDGSKILYVSQVQYSKRVKDIYPDIPLSSGKVIDDLMYKHWDEWVETIPHPFVADLTDKGVKNVIDILKGQPYESPMKPWGDIEQLAWSPDGKSIAYTCRKKTGKDYALSTNSDIYLYSLESKKTKNLTEGMMGYDTNPVFSPNGKYIVFQSMERDGYESDRDRLFIHNFKSDCNYCISDSLDGDVSSVCWNKDGSIIYFLSALQAVTQIFSVDVETASVKQLTDGMFDFVSIALAGNQLVGLRHSLSHPDDIYRIDPANGKMVALTDENKEIYAQLKVGRVEKRMIETTDKKQMLTWVVYPPDFDSTKIYPTILYCSGGPQGTVGQFWSYRWNLQLMAANGYIIVAPNRRGVSGLGQAWKEQISKDYGGQNMKDYLSAIDAVAKEPYVDKAHLGCVGASYGGFSVYWLAGHHQKRF